MHAILTISRNNLNLTQRAIRSFVQQNINATVLVIDNGSTDGSKEWLQDNGWLLHANPDNAGVSSQWNRGLNWFFGAGFESVLVMGNDTWIPEYFYRELLSYNLPFVTGVAVDNMEQVQPKPSKMPLDYHPDFSAFLIRKRIWEDVGPFDERMKLYASDCDWHIRAHLRKWSLFKASCEFYHERSSTLRNAPAAEAQEIQEQANRDRAILQSLYGCLPGDTMYEAIFAHTPVREMAAVPESHDNISGTDISPASHNPSTVAAACPSSAQSCPVSAVPDPETGKPDSQSTQACQSENTDR